MESISAKERANRGRFSALGMVGLVVPPFAPPEAGAATVRKELPSPRRFPPSFRDISKFPRSRKARENRELSASHPVGPPRPFHSSHSPSRLGRVGLALGPAGSRECADRLGAAAVRASERDPDPRRRPSDSRAEAAPRRSRGAGGLPGERGAAGVVGRRVGVREMRLQ